MPMSDCWPSSALGGGDGDVRDEMSDTINYKIECGACGSALTTSDDVCGACGESVDWCDATIV